MKRKMADLIRIMLSFRIFRNKKGAVGAERLIRIIITLGAGFLFLWLILKMIGVF
ncbi:MAG TPA: hypothetical protein QGI22_00145 [Candidatus Woesearchaeota archaeon]|jgi:hypothetical protein|nr:hypothetical protein [Candidatus Woesearchaeota archaeon]|tara:strand:+ start:10428 stop:10592 length:165 start_codon:yes stop_codon:yes gene_type:complete